MGSAGSSIMVVVSKPNCPTSKIQRILQSGNNRSVPILDNSNPFPKSLRGNGTITAITIPLLMIVIERPWKSINNIFIDILMPAGTPSTTSSSVSSCQLAF
jgi:hypothetical protein